MLTACLDRFERVTSDRISSAAVRMTGGGYSLADCQALCLLESGALLAGVQCVSIFFKRATGDCSLRPAGYDRSSDCSRVDVDFSSVGVSNCLSRLHYDTVRFFLLIQNLQPVYMHVVRAFRSISDSPMTFDENTEQYVVTTRCG